MNEFNPIGLDLMPPPFAEGLADWSRGDGTPDSPTYEDADNVRLARGDVDFGTCLEVFKTEAVQRLRYMGELPVRTGLRIEIAARVKALRGPLPAARIAAWPGTAAARGLPDLPSVGPEIQLVGHEQVVELRAVIGPSPAAGTDLVWDARVLYAHVGLDLTGRSGGVIRIESLRVRELD